MMYSVTSQVFVRKIEFNLVPGSMFLTPVVASMMANFRVISLSIGFKRLILTSKLCRFTIQILQLQVGFRITIVSQQIIYLNILLLMCMLSALVGVVILVRVLICS